MATAAKPTGIKTGEAGQTPLAVITGASSGIGFEIAKLFAQDGYDLIIAAEDEGLESCAGLLRSYGVQVQSVRADLRKFEEVENFYNVIQSSAQPVDALVLNAGVGACGAFVDIPLQRELDMISLNVMSVVHLAKRVLNDMNMRGAGRVLITASVVSDMPNPFQAVYSATKAFLLNFAEAVRSELKDSGVTVTALMPGPTDTNFFARADLDDTKMGQSKKDDPADVALDGYQAMMRGDDKVVSHSWRSKAMGMMAAAMPDKMVADSLREQTKPGSATKQ